ncbi:DUF502 domain-containing protein [bacterium]|nr:DUF502 domain-containing protein [bacterium]
MKELRNAFITGALLLVPIVATLNLLVWLIASLEGSVRNFMPTSYLPFDFPGLGLVFSITIILLVGTAAKNHVGQASFNFFDSMLRKAPLAGSIYSTIRKFLETILNPQSDKFHGVVLVHFPSQQHLSIGFRTGKPDRRLGAPADLVNVFVPCTPNPTSGFYLLVKESELTPLDISVQEAFKIVISMGIVTLDEEGTAHTK